MQVEGSGAPQARPPPRLRRLGGGHPGGANAGRPTQPVGPPPAAIVAAPAFAPFLPPPKTDRDGREAVRISQDAKELRNRGLHERADAVLRQGIERFPGNTVLWNQLIALHSRDTTVALTLAEQMKRSGARADAVTYNTLISVMSWAQQPDLCWQVYWAMVAAGVARDRVTYGTLFDAFAQASRVRDLREAFLLMRANRVRGDAAAYTVLIGTLAAADQPSWAWEAFEAMQADGLVGTERVFRAIVEGCCRAGKPRHAWQAVLVMVRTRAVWGETFLKHLASVVLDAFVARGELQRGREVVEHLRAHLAAGAPPPAAP